MRDAPFRESRQGDFQFDLLENSTPEDLYFVTANHQDRRFTRTAPVCPFLDKEPIPGEFLVTSVNLDTSSGASGIPHRRDADLQGNSVQFAPYMQKGLLHPAVIRSCHWDFEHFGFDRLGGPELNLPGKVYDSVRKCLRFTGTERIRMPLRSWPIGNMTLEFQLYPAKEQQGQIAELFTQTGGWQAACNIRLLADGRIEAIRVCDKKNHVTVSILSEQPIRYGKWSTIRLVFSEKEMSLYLNGKMSASAPVPLHRRYGNSTVMIGGNYRGLLDDIRLTGMDRKLPPSKAKR
ncbi:MAG: hypothetical protein PHS41_10365 [Victivallaceae bacterium]|nr:hypothetical protein [Victivallaceae bacterium]